MQEELSRFSHRADKQQDADQFERVDIVANKLYGNIAHMTRLGKAKWRNIRIVFNRAEDWAKLDRAEHKEHRHNAKRQTKIPDPVCHKGFNRRIIGRRLCKPETDEQIRGKPHAFPAKEKLQEVIGHNQHQHGEGKERQIGKETAAMWIVCHISPGIEMHQTRHTRNHSHHRNGQRIHTDRPVSLKSTNIDPIHQRNDMGVIGNRAAMSGLCAFCGEQDMLGHLMASPAAKGIVKQLIEREYPGQTNRAGGHGHGELVTKNKFAKSSNQRGDARSEDNK